MTEETCKNCMINDKCPGCDIHEKNHHEPCKCCEVIVRYTVNV